MGVLNAPSVRSRFATFAIYIFAAVAAIVIAGDAFSQNLSLGKRTWEGKADCPRCHAWSGLGGVGEDDRAPQGANLRETVMDRAALEEVIKCGLPGTEMPFFSRLAWTDDDHRCFGMTRAEAGNLVPFQAERNLIQREIDALLDYMFAKVVGRGEISREECEEYFSPGSERCRLYRTAAEIAAAAG